MINNASQNFHLSIMIQTTSTQITSKMTSRSKPIILNLEQLHTFNDHLKIILIFTHISLLVYLHQIFQNMNQIVHIKPQFRFTSVKQYLRSTVTELLHFAPSKGPRCIKCYKKVSNIMPSHSNQHLHFFLFLIIESTRKRCHKVYTMYKKAP